MMLSFIDVTKSVAKKQFAAVSLINCDVPHSNQANSGHNFQANLRHCG